MAAPGLRTSTAKSQQGLLRFPQKGRKLILRATWATVKRPSRQSARHVRGAAHGFGSRTRWRPKQTAPGRFADFSSGINGFRQSEVGRERRPAQAPQLTRSRRRQKVRTVAAHPQPVHSVEPELDTPDADLLAWEAELEELLLEHERLEADRRARSLAPCIPLNDPGRSDVGQRR